MNRTLSALLATASLAALSACTTTPKPTDGRPVLTSQYIAALARIDRVPQPNPLLDEGLIPQPVLHLVIAYQEAVRANHYRPLAKFHEPHGHPGDLENALLAKETRSTSKIAVLVNVTRGQNHLGRTAYEFTFANISRTSQGRSEITYPSLTVESTPDGKHWITGVSN